MTLSIDTVAQAVAACGGYSEGRFRSWKAVAKMLLLRGYSPLQAEAIMRSKWTRWASDQAMGIATVKHMEDFLDDPRNTCTFNEVEDLIRQTPSELSKEMQRVGRLV